MLDADVARLSPYMRRHINVHGHYSFAPADLAGARRALRDPDAPDDDDLTERRLIASRDTAGNRPFHARSRRIWSIY